MISLYPTIMDISENMEKTNLSPETKKFQNIYEKFLYESFTSKELGKSKHDYFVRHLYKKAHYYRGQMFKNNYPSYKKVIHCAEWLNENNHPELVQEFCNAFGYVYKKNGGELTDEYRKFINEKIKALKTSLKNKNTESIDLFDDVSDKFKEYAKVLKSHVESRKGPDEKKEYLNMVFDNYKSPKYNPKKSDEKNNTTKITNKTIAQCFTDYENIFSTHILRYRKITNAKRKEIFLSSIKDKHANQNRRQSVNRKLLFLLVFVLELNRKETEELFRMTDCFLDKEGKYLVEDKILWDLLPALPHLKHLTVAMFAKKLASFEEMEKKSSVLKDF